MAITDLTHLIDPGHAPRVVLKVGSSLLVGPDGLARRDWLTAFAAEIAEMRQRGQQVVVVSSGAIALGGAELDPSRDPRRTLAAAQASAAVGQIALASLWSDKLAGHGLAAGQMLVTLDDLEDRRRYLNASATLGPQAGRYRMTVLHVPAAHIDKGSLVTIDTGRRACCVDVALVGRHRGTEEALDAVVPRTR